MKLNARLIRFAAISLFAIGAGPVSAAVAGGSRFQGEIQLPEVPADFVDSTGESHATVAGALYGALASFVADPTALGEVHKAGLGGANFRVWITDGRDDIVCRQNEVRNDWLLYSCWFSAKDFQIGHLPRLLVQVLDGYRAPDVVREPGLIRLSDRKATLSCRYVGPSARPQSATCRIVLHPAG